MPTTRAAATRTTWPRRRRRACCARAWATITLQTLAYGEAIDAPRRAASACIRPATCSARRRCGSSTRGQVWVVLGRLFASGRDDADETTPPARRSSRCAATASSPSRPSACRSTAGGRSARCSPTSTPGGAATPQPGAPACCSATASARRSACSPASTRRIGPIVVHGAVETLNQAYRDAGVALPPTQRAARGRRTRPTLRGALVVAPPSVQGSPWLQALRRLLATPSPAAGCSCAARAGAGVDRGFVLSDHADWPGLQRAIAATGAAARHRHARLRGGDGALAAPSRACRPRRSRPSTATTTTSCRRPRSTPARGAATGGDDAHEALRAPVTPNSTRAPRPTPRSRRCERYFARRAPADAAWAVYFLAGGKPRQVVPTARAARAGRAQRAGIDDWLFEECYQAVGDLAETIAHVLPPPTREQRRRPGRLGRAAPAAAARRRRRRAGRAHRRVLGRARRGRALPADQADRRRLSRRRQQAAGAARAGRARRHRCQARRAAHDGLHRRAARRPTRQRFARAGRRGRQRRARGAASPIRSSWPIRSTARRRIRPRSARPPTGWSNGSTTASARRSSSAPARSGSGRAARSW